MPLRKYFKEGQKISLKSLNTDNVKLRVDSLTCYLINMGRGYLDLNIPYGGDQAERYPFDPATNLEILSSSMGIGVRVTGQFEKYLSDNVIRVSHNSDLKLIRRRIEERCETVLELGYTKGKGKLKSFRQQWEKNISILGSNKAQAKFPKLKANLSMTGIGFQIKTPLAVSDLCLLYVNLADGGPPVCAMSEVVWRSEDETNGRCLAGFQFLNILETDRNRISKFVTMQLTNAAKSDSE